MQKEWRSKDIVVIQKENNVYLEDDGNKISLNIEELSSSTFCSSFK